MITGDKGAYKPEKGNFRIFGRNHFKFVTNPSKETPSSYRGGAIYGGVIYKGYSYLGGVNSEKVLNKVQNFLHVITKTPYYFGDAGYKPKPWSYFGNYNFNNLIY